MRAPSAQLTVLWGTSPIAVGRVDRGAAAAIGADGRIRALALGDPVEPGAVIVEMSVSGARVWSIDARASMGATPRETARERIATGQIAERAIGPRDRSPIYRVSRVEQAALGVRVEIADAAPAGAVTKTPVVSSRSVATTAASAAAHALAFAVALRSTPTSGNAIASEASSFGQVYLAAEDGMEPPPEPGPQATGEASGAAPQYCAAYEGRAPSPLFALQGPADNPDPHLASRRSVPRAHAPEWILGPARGWSGGGWEEPIVPWGREDSLGRDERSAMNALPGPHVCRRDWSCFGEPIQPWSCYTGMVELPSIERVGLAGIGDDPVLPEDPWRWHRPPRVVVGPRMIAANVPRWAVTAALAPVEERARACYQRLLADDPHVTGSLHITVRVRGDEEVSEVTPSGGLRHAPALTCCVREAHAWVPYDLPARTRANVVYRIDFGHQPANRGAASGVR